MDFQYSPVNAITLAFESGRVFACHSARLADTIQRYSSFQAVNTKSESMVSSLLLLLPLFDHSWHNSRHFDWDSADDCSWFAHKNSQKYVNNTIALSPQNGSIFCSIFSHFKFMDALQDNHKLNLTNGLWAEIIGDFYVINLVVKMNGHIKGYCLIEFIYFIFVSTQMFKMLSILKRKSYVSYLKILN